MNENDCERRKLEDLLKLTHESLANENYGVKKITTLTRFGFDPINCTPGDVMHILLEGIARKLVKIFLDIWIKEEKARTDIREINLRLDLFVYGYSDEKNKVKYFQNSDLKKNQIVITASQMMTLIMLFPFIFYDILDITSKEYE